MDSTTKRRENNDKKDKKSFFGRFFGADLLLSEQMRPWYPYIVFVLLLVGVLVIGEQRINDKNQEINRLENEYKAELSKLKANNQFIPYEENQILIQKMMDRGYVLNEEHNYTVTVHKPAEEKKHLLFFWKNKKKDPMMENTDKQEDVETDDDDGR